MVNLLIIIASVFYLFVFLIILAILTPTSPSSTLSPVQSPLPTPEVKGVEILREEDASILVTKVVDGDTIALENGEVVRYIGVDTRGGAGWARIYPLKQSLYFVRTNMPI